MFLVILLLVFCAAEAVFQKYTDAFAIVGMVVGLCLCFAGYRVFKATVFLSGAICFGGSAYWATYQITMGQTYQPTATLVAGLVAGVVGGCIALCMWRLGLLCIGILLGASLAMLLNTLVVVQVVPQYAQYSLYTPTPSSSPSL